MTSQPFPTLETDRPRDYGMLIGGEEVPAASGETIDVITPIDRHRVVARVPRGRAEDADRAVRAARAAYPGWAALPFVEPGMAKDAPCGALLSRAAEAGQSAPQ